MKTHITLRSAIDNTSWMVRDEEAMPVAAFGLTLALTVRSDKSATAAAPAVQHAAPAARDPNVPINGTGSAYDGGQYSATRPATFSSSVPVVGTGLAYDDAARGVGRPVTHNPNVPLVGTGLAYNDAA